MNRASARRKRAVAVTVAEGASADAIEVTPDAPLLPGTDYWLWIDEGMTDAHGVAFESDPTLVSFSTL